ncbi:protein AF-10 isoform X2 [Zootermopsis nevadensis]|uniref:protein AF-10 isoform X2 n=1 Tax=Zootermopsis nevadensis TaxID=136037 RepID=UPI000B8E370D|nr:protein AF-10 isoform X2 [Zootermopsis nevadensis]
MKEMVGGCCVCSDERGWAENPLVYCDGQGCTVAVHQACYGIVTVPTGPWFCRKCESQERAARVRCELCPSKDGALKKTDNSAWAHVVCALYIPEVRFGNVTTMEPIILQLIPTERFSKACYICEEQGKGSRATVGACMQCNKTGCRQQFHVTCAQALGLLCEEAGNYLDNVKYCGYCQYHYSKLKGGNVKTIPPYKPIPADNGFSDSSPEKDPDSMVKAGVSGKRKGTGKATTTTTTTTTTSAVVGSKIGATGGKSVVGGHSPNLGDGSSTNAGGDLADINKSSNSSVGLKDASNLSSSAIMATSAASIATSGNTKFTTSNFVETVVTQSESVFGADIPTVSQANMRVSSAAIPASTNSSTGSSNITGKKRKAGGSRTPTTPDNSSDITSVQTPVSIVSGTTGMPTVAGSVNAVVGNVSVSSGGIDNHSGGMLGDSKKLKVESGGFFGMSASGPNPMPLSTVSESVVVSNVNSRPLSGNVITSAPSAAGSVGSAISSGSIVVSVPLAATSIQPPTSAASTVVTSAPTLFQQLQQSSVVTSNAAVVTAANASAVHQQQQHLEDQPGKRARTQSTEKPEKGRKQKRGNSGTVVTTTMTGLTTSAITSTTTAAVVTGASINNSSKRGSRGGNGNNPTPPPVMTHSVPIHVSTTTAVIPTSSIVKDSPPSSPGSETLSIHSGGRNSKTKSSKRSSSGRDRDDKDIKLFQNGVSAPHMLGNQLNPSSTMAQKMSDTLSAEMEAHSIFNDSSNSTTSLIGPQLHSRVIASVRNANSASGASAHGSTAGTTTNPICNNAASSSVINPTSSISNHAGNSTGTAAVGSIPQSLDQLLERQWEQGSQFLMEQAQHFDIASLLSCLHQLRAENLRLEEHVNSLLQRRDHLLAVNARLAIPLTTQPAPVNNVHPGSGSVSHQHSDPSRNPRINNTYVSSHPMENGLPPDPSPPSGYPHQHRSPAAQPSPTVRQSPASSGYMLSQSPLNPPPGSAIVSPASSTPGVVRSTSATPDSLRGADARRSSQQQSGYPVYQVVSSPATVSSHQNPQVPVVTTQQVIRRDTVNDLHHQMPSTKPS